MSRVYRFHGPSDLSVADRRVRLRKRKKRVPANLHLIGVDESSISDRQGTRGIETYTAVEARAVTLTKREADLIALANPGIAAPDALEELHPWLPACRFLNNSRESLKAVETIVRRFSQHFVSASTFCDEK